MNYKNPLSGLALLPILDIFSIIESEEKGQLKDLNPSIGSIYNQVKIVDGKIVGIEATFILKDKKDGKDNWEKIG